VATNELAKSVLVSRGRTIFFGSATVIKLATELAIASFSERGGTGRSQSLRAIGPVITLFYRWVN
jgi:hypothetical protein